MKFLVGGLNLLKYWFDTRNCVLSGKTHIEEGCYEHLCNL